MVQKRNCHYRQKGTSLPGFPFHCVPGGNPCGHHETVAEQEGVGSLHLHKVLRVKLDQVRVVDQVTTGNIRHTLQTGVEMRRRSLDHHAVCEL